MNNANQLLQSLTFFNIYKCVMHTKNLLIVYYTGVCVLWVILPSMDIYQTVMAIFCRYFNTELFSTASNTSTHRFWLLFYMSVWLHIQLVLIPNNNKFHGAVIAGDHGHTYTIYSINFHILCWETLFGVHFPCLIYT